MNQLDPLSSSISENHLAPLPERAARSSILNGLKILVVDDCPDNQFLFSRLLTRRGAVVTLASDGQQGVDFALATAFDLVMMDIQMPVMDGYTAMDNLKIAGYNVPVIAVTASSHLDEKIKIINAGFSKQVTKPIDIDGLIEIIQELTHENSNFLAGLK